MNNVHVMVSAGGGSMIIQQDEMQETKQYAGIEDDDALPFGEINVREIFVEEHD